VPPPTTAVVAPAVSRVTFIDNDYPRALAEAKRRGVPLFVDAWAPWCHSCVSLREYVFTSRELAKLDGKIVFAAVDTEKESNAAFVRKFPNDVYPTLYVIDPQTERATIRWGGTATAAELVQFLSDAALPEGGAHEDALAAFVRGNASAAAGDYARADIEYRDALARSNASFRERPRVVEAAVSSLYEEEKWGECVFLATRELPSLPHGSSRATVIASAMECADEGKLSNDALLAAARADLESDDGAILADDRSSLFDSVVSALESRGDKAAARAEAERWAKFLEDAASRAPTAEARAVFDPHRLLAYIAAGRPLAAVPMLEQSAKDFPHDYNPKSRLATAYLEANDLEHARAYVELAFKDVYGPRTLRVADLAVKIATAQKKPDDAARFLSEALARTKDLPLTRKQRSLFDKKQKELSALRGRAASPSAE
jgi:thiol-disulfide isomerase/thioredoxin